MLEEHKSGFPHFHLVVRSPYVAQEELSRDWCKLTDAFIVDIRKIDPGRRVARYISKYLTKQTSPGFTNRRVSFTRSFFPPTPEREKLNLNLQEVQRERGSALDVVGWTWPGTSLEQVSSCHWIIRRQMPHADSLPVTAKSSDHWWRKNRSRLDEILSDESSPF